MTISVLFQFKGLENLHILEKSDEESEKESDEESKIENEENENIKVILICFN